MAMFETVLIESYDAKKKAVYGSSAILINKSYAISTANAIFPVLGSRFFAFYQKLTPTVLHSSNLNELADFRIFSRKVDGLEEYGMHKAHVLAVFVSDSLKRISRRMLQDWAVGSISDRSKMFKEELTKICSLFVVFATDSASDLYGFKNHLTQWWNLTKNLEIGQSDEIFVRSAPFGNRALIGSHSRGIVSNILGEDSCLVVSDCPTTPGSEGSPVYNYHSEIPIGLVVSSLSWWKGHWTGLTLIADIRPVLLELLPLGNQLITRPHPRIVAILESSLLQVYCGSQWGTAVLVDDTKGILVTNSHVVLDPAKGVRLYLEGQPIKAEVVYKTPNDETFDLAVLKSDPAVLKTKNLRSVRVCKKLVKTGDDVYSAGFPLFSKDALCGPSLSKGVVCQVARSMIKTTCCVNPGMSGGAILNRCGELVGIVVCNTKLRKMGSVFPRYNMAVPYACVDHVIKDYLITGDGRVLDALHTRDPNMVVHWTKLESKL